MEVIGLQSTAIMEKDANSAITERQRKCIKGDENVQNRPVVAKMLPIDWIFAQCGLNNKMGFS